jgi:hypothetical protein
MQNITTLGTDLLIFWKWNIRNSRREDYYAWLGFHFFFIAGSVFIDSVKIRLCDEKGDVLVIWTKWLNLTAVG